MKFYVIESYPGKKYLPENELRRATYEDVIEGGYSYFDLGLTQIETEDGDCLYESQGNSDFEGIKSWNEIADIETDLYCVYYWDGNNWKLDLFELSDFEETIEVELESFVAPNPAYCFNYELVTNDGKRVPVSQSNMSGSLSPYYIGLIQEEK